MVETAGVITTLEAVACALIVNCVDIEVMPWEETVIVELPTVVSL